VKKDGRREDFHREKLLGGLRKACEKRPIAAPELDEVVAEIEARVAGDGRPELPSSFVGELAMDALRRLDHIAYIRFASVYRAFSDIETLKEAIAAVEEGRVPTLEERDLQLPLIAGEGVPGSAARLVGGERAALAGGKQAVVRAMA
jgi:transcriptional repressor NrdR